MLAPGNIGPQSEYPCLGHHAQNCVEHDCWRSEAPSKKLIIFLEDMLMLESKDFNDGKRQRARNYFSSSVPPSFPPDLRRGVLAISPNWRPLLSHDSIPVQWCLEPHKPIMSCNVWLTWVPPIEGERPRCTGRNYRGCIPGANFQTTPPSLSKRAWVSSRPSIPWRPKEGGVRRLGRSISTYSSMTPVTHNKPKLLTLAREQRE